MPIQNQNQQATDYHSSCYGLSARYPHCFLDIPGQSGSVSTHKWTGVPLSAPSTLQWRGLFTCSDTSIHTTHRTWNIELVKGIFWATLITMSLKDWLSITPR